ncbi:MAG: hypothetical protein ABJG86_10395 [Nitratireductor sp.]|jgi:hypothetical protein
MGPLEILFSPFVVMTAHPWAVYVPVVVLGLMGWATPWGGTMVKVAAALWLAYALWETAVQIMTPEANIRVDLLVIAPILVVVSLAALALFLRKAFARV